MTFRETGDPSPWKTYKWQTQDTFKIYLVRINVASHLERFLIFWRNVFQIVQCLESKTIFFLILKKCHIWEESRSLYSIHALVELLGEAVGFHMADFLSLSLLIASTAPYYFVLRGVIQTQGGICCFPHLSLVPSSP